MPRLEWCTRPDLGFRVPICHFQSGLGLPLLRPHRPPRLPERAFPAVEQVVYFFRQVLGLPVVSKEVLSQRTRDCQNWVEAYARNHQIPIEWAEKGVRKEDYVSPRLNRLVRKKAYGVYFIFKSMEQGRTFRISVPKYPTPDPNYRILAHQRSRFTHYYFYIRDEVLGPIVMRVGSFFPFQTSYYLNGHSFIEQELKRAQKSDGK